RPPLRRDALPLHEHPYVFADTIRQNEPPRLFALFAKKDWIGRRDFIQRLEQLVFSRAGGEQKFRLAIEEQRRKSITLARALQIRGVDVRGQVLLAGICEQVARELLRRIGSGRSEAE